MYFYKKNYFISAEWVCQCNEKKVIPIEVWLDYKERYASEYRMKKYTIIAVEPREKWTKVTIMYPLNNKWFTFWSELVWCENWKLSSLRMKIFISSLTSREKG